jgi:predicted nucleic acid-binding protein
MKRRLYIETTVVSYLTARPSRDLIIAGHQEATRDLWPKLNTEFEVYVSSLVFEEAGRGDKVQAKKRLNAIKPFPMLEIDAEARELSKKIMAERGVPKEYPEDALHIAIATVNGIDLIITWNFAHFNNPFTRKKIRSIIEEAGYISPEICSPEELLEID